MTKIYRFFSKGAEILSLVFMSLLLLSGFLITSYVNDMEMQTVMLRWDNLLLNLLLLAGILLILAAFLYLAKKNYSLAKKILLTIVGLWILLIGIFLILGGRTIPAADSYTVYHISKMLALDNTSVIHPTDSYLSYYPQQIGLVAFLEPLIRLWNLLPIHQEAYHYLKMIYVLLALIIVYFQYLTVQFLFKNDVADILYLCIAGLNFPFLMYTSFVYSEIPSFAAISVGLYFFFRMIKAVNESSDRQRILFTILSILFLSLSVMLRKNSLILIIAVVIVSFLLWLKDFRKYLFLIFTVCCIIGSLSILPVTQKVYELRAGNTLSSGVPAMNYFAMGMQDAGRGCGWYNGFNIQTYEESGLDTVKSVEVSKVAIAERLEYFKAHPDYALSFYLQKYLGQWTDGTYACRQATQANFGGRHAFFDAIYIGSLEPWFIEHCNVFQNLIYLGCFALCLGLFTKKHTLSDMDSLPLLVGIITAFGGFLFHMIWEASGRYIFSYGMILIPFAVGGIELLLTNLNKLLRAVRKNQ